MKVAFFGTSEFGIPALRVLYESHNEISIVVVTPDAVGKRGKRIIEPPVKVEAQRLGLKVWQPDSLKGKAAVLGDEKIDIGVVVSYGKIIPAELLCVPRFGMVNIHPSLLPVYRGPSPIQTAILNGDDYTGVSIIGVTESLDAGPIYMQWVEEIKPEDNYRSLHDRLSIKGADMILCAVEYIFAGSIKPRAQDEFLASYTSIIRKEDGKISFKDETARSIVNKIRAFHEWPGAFFFYGGKRYIVLEAKEIEACGEPSRVLDMGKGRLVIAAKKNAVEILKIQPESKKAMDAKAFLAGNRLSVNEEVC